MKKVKSKISNSRLRIGSGLLSLIFFDVLLLALSSAIYIEVNRLNTLYTEQEETAQAIERRLERLATELEVYPDLKSPESVLDRVIKDVGFEIDNLQNNTQAIREGGEKLDRFLGKALAYLAFDISYFDMRQSAQENRASQRLTEANERFRDSFTPATFDALNSAYTQYIDIKRNELRRFENAQNALPVRLLTLNMFLFFIFCVLVYFLWFRCIKSTVAVLDKRNFQLQEHTKKLNQMAYNDQVTGVKNRQFFTNALNLLVANNDGKVPFAIVLVDINRFKAINMSYGYKAGDLMLQEVAAALTDIYPAERVMRLNSDEFAIIDERTDRSEITRSIRNIFNKTREPIRFNGHIIQCQISVGVAFYPDDAHNLTQLRTNADIALRTAKETKGINRHFVFYSDLDYNHYDRALPQYQDILKGLNNDEFTVKYSPQFSLKSKEILGAEALLRWNNPEFADINIEHLIESAEQVGLIARLTQVVLQDVLAVYETLVEEGYDGLKMAINFSGDQLAIQQETQSALKLLEKHPDLARSLVVEITEKVIFGARGRELSKTLDPLRELGVQVSLDDFGTGYASLTHLTEVEFDALKVDRSFVRDMEKSETAKNIVKSIVLLATAMDKQVVAEGVETESQLRKLHSLGCDQGQGYYMSRPIDKAQFIELVVQHQNN